MIDWSIAPGEIIEDGVLMCLAVPGGEDKIGLRYGRAYVTPEQAVRAAPHGWKVVGEEGDLVIIERPAPPRRLAVWPEPDAYVLKEQ
jgi:hypothetical protein